ncbi:TetR/AcrR family transcriptional regulator [Planotetraspora sp. A-T 1434]|uniref:TetR/AcrR family transcriptional regulator n=1 Tax=Planotetraspora sp. A-T 1434 TaxID=2979219 RepID=UPI0021BF8F3F|nr:TetR/AcrR family transcriptional regulator [Planotetraspora sp. A-T 1434]MCT9933967.1 TetR/AcrR family transcriptional regulator [Planotetraspora sp. A-T 1434]
MGRRRGTTKGDRRERAILDTARDLLSTTPVGRLTIDQLTAGAGISRSSFYFYFDSKTAVLEALLDEIAEEMVEAARRWLDGSGDDPDSLRHALEVSARLWREHGPLLRQALLAEDQEFASFRENVVARYVKEGAARIARDRQEGLAGPGPDPQSLAHALIRMKFAVFAADSSVEAVETLCAVVRRAMYGALPATGS